MGSKLGIIFAFLLSVAAAGGSYYLYQGWVEEKTVRGSIEAKYDQVKEKMVTVQSEKEQLEEKAGAMQDQLEKLQSEQSRIDAEKSRLENQLKSHQSMISELQKQVSELAQKAKEAQAACGVTPADLQTPAIEAPKPFEPEVSPKPFSATSGTETEDSKLVFKPMTPASSKVPESPSAPSAWDAQETAAPAAPAVTEVASSTEPVSQTVSAVSPEPVREVPGEMASAGGKVLTVNRKFNFVVINQGLQDGLKMGDRLKVLKDGQETATIQVEKLYDKFSAATILEEDQKRQVVEGDEIRRV